MLVVLICLKVFNRIYCLTGRPAPVIANTIKTQNMMLLRQQKGETGKRLDFIQYI